MKRSKLSVIALLALQGCTIPDRIATLGQPPSLTNIQDPTKLPEYQPVSMPMPKPMDANQDSNSHEGNSLWQAGSRAFFKDQRASKVGDVVTVKVKLDQKQAIEMTPDIERQNQSTNAVNNALGFERKAEKLFPKKQPGAAGAANKSWLDVSSDSKLKATAKYDVKDQMEFKIAAYVIQVLPNGNLVVHGRQEIRLINELREVLLKGIVRKEDIMSNNTVASEKIAELRISYGGRGDLTDMQSFPLGQQLANKILPF